MKSYSTVTSHNVDTVFAHILIPKFFPVTYLLFTLHIS